MSQQTKFRTDYPTSYIKSELSPTELDDTFPLQNDFARRAMDKDKETLHCYDGDWNCENYETLSESELTEIAAETRSIEDRKTRCLPSMFQDKAYCVRFQKATVINLYYEYGGNWTKVVNDKRGVGLRTLQTYFQDEIFRARVEALDPMLTMSARGVVIEMFSSAQDEKTRLAAALRWLEYADGEHWDKGIRKQIVANKGAIQNTLLTQAVTDKQYLDVLVKDRLNALPEKARLAIKQAINELEDNIPIDITPEKVPDSSNQSLLTTVDVNTIDDPFKD